MCIYTYIDIFLFLLIIIEVYHPNKRKSNFLFYVGGFVVFFILAFRGTHVGGDIEDYLGFYNGEGGMYGTLNSPNDNQEFGFTVFSRFLHLISGNEIFYLFTVSCFTILPFLFLIYKTSSIKTIPLFLYMTQWHVIGISQTAFRQCVAVGVFILAYVVYNRLLLSSVSKRTRYCICTLLIMFSITMHSTMLLYVPLFFILYFIPYKKTIVIVSLLISLFLINIFESLFPTIYNFFVTILRGFEYAQNMARYGDSFGNSLTNDYLGISTVKIMITIVFCVYTLCATPRELNSVPFKCLIAACIIYNIGTQFYIIQRFIYSLALLGITFVPQYLFKNIRTIKPQIVRAGESNFRFEQYVSFFRFLVVIILLWYIRVDIGHYNNNYENVYIDSQMLPYNLWLEEL